MRVSLIQALDKIPDIGDRVPIQLRHLIADRLGEAVRNDTLENLIPFDSLPRQYQISKVVLWDCLLALKFEPHELNGQIYLTVKDLERLDRFIKRIEIAWACPHVLGTCCRKIEISKI